jgi:hypothetical protein
MSHHTRNATLRAALRASLARNGGNLFRVTEGSPWTL